MNRRTTASHNNNGSINPMSIGGSMLCWWLTVITLAVIVSSNTSQSIPIFDQLFDTFFSSSSSNESRRLSPLPKSDNDDYFRQYGDTRIWMTISPDVIVDNVDNPVVNAVEIHWRRSADNPPKSGDYLALFSVNNTKSPIFRYLLPTNSTNQTNYVRTDISFPYLNETLHPSKIIKQSVSNRSDEFNLPLCLHYYLIYFDAQLNKVQTATCIRLNPNWMKDTFDLIKNRKLTEILIPGTHDASSYEHYGDDYEADLITRFQFTQDDMIYNQLKYGIRYLDFRIGAYNISNDQLQSSNIPQQPSTSSPFNRSSVKWSYHEELWMVHDIERNHLNLSEALRQVKRFIEETTHEIVIVDFHRFVSGFVDSDDMTAIRKRLEFFKQTIMDELEPHLIPYSHNRMTIGELMNEPGRRVVLGYAYKGDTKVMVDSPLFWPAVSHLWAQTDELGKLEQFIDKNVCKSAPFFIGPNSEITDFNRLRSVMAELTPTIQNVLLLKYHGLRELAEMVNIHYDTWFRQRWWKCSNIVAADFFLGSDIVQIAIDVNERRAKEL